MLNMTKSYRHNQDITALGLQTPSQKILYLHYPSPNQVLIVAKDRREALLRCPGPLVPIVTFS